eukprot:2688561-Rhodomonas_salina.3
MEDKGTSITVNYADEVWMDGFWFRTRNDTAQLDPIRFRRVHARAHHLSSKSRLTKMRVLPAGSWSKDWVMGCIGRQSGHRL